ncbi:actin-like protein 6A [Tieghemostelium lacteum]|uniref:Actin-like protein 6A n=1 Tax=Tieghemostelium lacteum TaxID=361077 RepID=A0A152A416_TIELA|nr:actin-like protein 6A [Tieghemostelium lacteum]|eukprot:KYR00978.1 actin-like protein 6A [Tieghemostelium lacteum]
MYCGGDDLSAIVIDVGSFSTKGGYAGEDTPKDIFPTDVGCVFTDKDGNYVGSHQQGIGENQDIDIDVKKSYYTGTNSITYKRVGMDIINPLQDGLIKDWEAIEHIWNHTFHERLIINPGDHPILLAEPSFNSRSIREKVSEIMFEKYQVPALFISKNAVLSSFASCKATSLVLDSGGGMTSVVPVHEGYVLKNAIVKSNLAGNRLTEEYYKILNQKNIIVNPINLIKKVEIKPGEFHVTPLQIPGLTESYKRYVTLETIRDLKETSCRVADSSQLSEEMHISQVPYELPDGNLLEIGSDRFQIPELLFNPQPLNINNNNHMNTDTNNNNGNNDIHHQTYQPLSKMVIESIEKCDSDVRKEIFQNTILTGGNTLFSGFHDRLLRDISEQSFTLKPKIVPNLIERKNSVWIGGSILGSLGSFQQMWMSKSEWEEYGRPLVEKKCP